MRTLGIILLMIICLAACSQNDAEQLLKAQTSSAEIEIPEEMQAAIKEVLEETTGTYHIQIESVRIEELNDEDPTDDYAVDIHEYYIKVIETIIGVERTSFTMRSEVEHGEEPISTDARYVIGICDNGQEIFWPGIGTIFPATPEVIAYTLMASRQSTVDSHKELCDR